MKERKMPRAGPKPYEFVRRAWHSDRHQPIRGSLIKDIFRIANEVHSPETKKNKEWQEKLPIVVLKAEEVMYFKANSEDEYMDPKTLAHRVNDAIGTIIRRDETTETGEQFLQPCIEAALNLGCVPRRASRSQRNCNPRFYLNGSTSASCHPLPIKYTSTCPRNPNPASCPFTYPCSAFTKPLAKHFETDSQKSHVILPKIGNPIIGFSSQLKPRGAVYPLYNGTRPQTPDELGALPVKSNRDDEEVEETRSDPYPWCPRQHGISRNVSDECDLSLRLAPLSVSARAVGFESIPPGDAAGDSGSESLCLPRADKEASISPTVRKRKAADSIGDPKFPWQSKHPCSRSTGGATIAGL